MEEKVKELVSDFKLDEALDLLIAQAQTQNQRKQNTLLVLKGKLSLLEEQRLAGMLDADDIARQKAVIAHQILDIADGSPLDHELPQPKPEQVLIQKTVSAPANGKYLLIGGLLVAAVLVVVFFAKNRGNEPEKQWPGQTKRTTEPTSPAKNVSEEKTVEPDQPSSPAGDELTVLDFPNYRKKFNFLDFQINVREVKAEAFSDSEAKLTIRYFLKCRNNFGICYRAIPRVYADEQVIGPTEQLNAYGWVGQDSTITDELVFVIPNNAQSYFFEMSRDGSNWKRPFKIAIDH